MDTNNATDTKQFKRLQCVWGIVCTLSSIDQNRNNISLFNVIDEITIPSMYFKDGMMKFHCELVTVWRRLIRTDIDPEDIVADIKIDFIDPTGASLMKGSISNTRFSGKGRRTRLRLPFDRIVFSEPGDYYFRVSIKDKTNNQFVQVKEIPLEINKGTQQKNSM